jgi:hypothetical protein
MKISTKDKYLSEIEEINNTMIEYHQEDGDGVDEEYSVFSKKCENWDEEPEDQVFYEEIPLKKRSEYPPSCSQLYNYDKYEEDNDEINKLYCLGKVIQKQTYSSVNSNKEEQKLSPKKKKTSFRYPGKIPDIFCENFLKNGKCTKENSKKCNGIHYFYEIPFCGFECNRVTLENNFYDGACSKKHVRESMDNFLLRKCLKIPEKNNISVQFYKIPDDEQLRKILKMCKKANYEELEITIISESIPIEI